MIAIVSEENLGKQPQHLTDGLKFMHIQKAKQDTVFPEARFTSAVNFCSFCDAVFSCYAPICSSASVLFFLFL